MKKIALLGLVALIVGCSTDLVTGTTAQEALMLPAGAAAGGGSSGSGNRSASIVAGAGHLLLVFAATSGNTNTSPTASDNWGGTYSLVGTAPWAASANTASLFIADQASPNTTTATTVTVATGANTAGEILLVDVRQQLTAGPSEIRQFVFVDNQSAGTTPSLSFPLAADGAAGNLSLSWIADGTKPPGITAPVDWTIDVQGGQNAPVTGAELATCVGFTGTNVAWTSASASAWSGMIVELYATPL